MRTSKLYRASSKSKTSLKTTVPNIYVELCQMTENDMCEWTHKKIDGECVLEVRVVKAISKERGSK